MISAASNVYRTSAKPKDEPNPVLESWDRYRRAAAIYNFGLVLGLCGGFVSLLAGFDEIVLIGLGFMMLLWLLWVRVRRCRCPVCENPMLGGPYQESKIGPLLGAFPLTCTYCDAAQPERAKPNMKIFVAMLCVVSATAGALFWKVDSSGPTYTVRGMIFDTQARQRTELTVSTPKEDVKWSDGALRGRVVFQMSTGRLTGWTYVHGETVLWD